MNEEMELKLCKDLINKISINTKIKFLEIGENQLVLSKTQLSLSNTIHWLSIAIFSVSLVLFVHIIFHYIGGQ